MKSKFLQIYTTTDSKKIAKKIALTLVKEKLAACVQITGPIKSIYRWKGKVENAREWLCIIKCRAKQFRKIEARIKQIHTYQIPEIVAIPIAGGSPDYLNWLNED